MNIRLNRLPSKSIVVLRPDQHRLKARFIFIVCVMCLYLSTKAFRQDGNRVHSNSSPKSPSLRQHCSTIGGKPIFSHFEALENEAGAGEKCFFSCGVRRA